MEIRPYADADAADLWACKRAFETGLGETTGGEEKAAVYAEKLTDQYREEWFAWVDRCRDADERCLTVADDGDGVVGYVFVLPETMPFVWDAAVINEVYLDPAHRGTGVADDLMDAALALARDQDLPLDRVVLDVDPANERARGFYDRHGFEPWGELVARDL